MKYAEEQKCQLFMSKIVWDVILQKLGCTCSNVAMFAIKIKIFAQQITSVRKKAILMLLRLLIQRKINLTKVSLGQCKSARWLSNDVPVWRLKNAFYQVKVENLLNLVR